MKIERDQVKFLRRPSRKDSRQPDRNDDQNRDWANWSGNARYAGVAAILQRNVASPSATRTYRSCRVAQVDHRHAHRNDQRKKTTARVVCGGLAKVFLREFELRF